jgi:acetyl esterase
LALLIRLARRGYVVFNLEYRRGTRFYPAALADVCAATSWVQRNGGRFGADVDRLVVAGESAGGNLAAALAVTCSYRRRERWARAVWDAGVRPRAAAVACGILQVSEPERFRPKGLLGPWILECLHDAASNYLPDPSAAPGTYPLADPLLVLEGGYAPDRPLPPFFLGVGDRDPLAEDTHRFAAALERHGVPHESRLYRGGVHGFHVLLPWTDLARALWDDQFGFLTRTLGQPAP